MAAINDQRQAPICLPVRRQVCRHSAAINLIPPATWETWRGVIKHDTVEPVFDFHVKQAWLLWLYCRRQQKPWKVICCQRHKVWADWKLPDLWPFYLLCYRCKKHTVCVKLQLADFDWDLITVWARPPQQVWHASSHSDHSFRFRFK